MQRPPIMSARAKNHSDFQSPATRCSRGLEYARVIQRGLLLLALVTLRGLPAHAQQFQFLPEVDTYFKVNSNVQFYLQAKETREGGAPTQAEIGPSVELFVKPWVKLRDATVSEVNESKKRMIVFAAGYRYLPSPNTTPTNRLRLDFTPHLPMKAKFLISDRNRADLDWQSGKKFNWRYRNKLTVEKRLTINSYHPAPYVAAEVFYESQYNKWSTTALYAGCLFPIGRHVQIEPYYEHQNNTGKKPNQQLNQFGLALELHF